MMERDENPKSPTYWKKLEAEGKPFIRNKPGSQWRGEFSPLREQLPSNVFPREVRGRQAIEGVAERTRQDIGSALDATKGFFGRLLGRRPDLNIPEEPIWDPNKEQVPSGTPEELYKQRNDLEEMRLRQISTGIPIGQTFGKGYIPGGEAGLESFFARPDYERQFWRDTGRLPTRAESETGVYDVTPKSPFDLTPGAWYEGMPTPDPYNIQGNLIQASLSPNVIYNPPPADEPPVEEVDPAIGLEQEIENILIREREKQLQYLPGHPLYEAPFEPGTGPEFEPSDIRLIERGRTVKPEDIRMVGDQALLPGETVVPLPAAPAPYVEQFEAFTPEQEPPQIRKVKKPKVKKAKVKKPKKAKPTRTQLKAKAVKERKSRKSFESAVAKALRETPTVFRGGPPSVSSVKSKARKKAEAKSFAFEDVKARARGRR
jgi:hypothetical protein